MAKGNVQYEDIFLESIAISRDLWPKDLLGFCDSGQLDAVPQRLEKLFAGSKKVPFLGELAGIELAAWRLQSFCKTAQNSPSEMIEINPHLALLKVSFQHLSSFFFADGREPLEPVAGVEMVLIYCYAETGGILVRPPTSTELLALKVVAEGLKREAVAKEAGVAIGVVDAAMEEAAESGILLIPATLLKRDVGLYSKESLESCQKFLQSDHFSLQWHVTQACDLHCKHCYDRSNISPLTLEQGVVILDQFRDFVLEHHVHGQVTFTGGNPLLYQHFNELYRAAARRNFSLAILGNPAPKETIAELMDIQPLAFYQVSLEGLQVHNDSIRGEGHFERIMEFLEILAEFSIYSMVMLTLTRDNMGQVLELAEILRDKVDLFTFNRLSQVGEGAALAVPTKEEYHAFLQKYVKAARENPILGLKDNLINILRFQDGLDPFGGCTGYGCGAAFNFASLLPDGELHACRKFPSPIGSVHSASLTALYHSEAAERFRRGSESCRNCKIRPVCGGCLAVTHSSGLDISTGLDPFCFLEDMD